MKLINLKGTVDYTPTEQIIRNYISDTLRGVFESYGYKPIATPIICYYDLLKLKYETEDDILKEVYKLTDQGDRDLGLRYDLTVPFAKYIALNKGISLPFKRYEIGEVFRDGPVKLGRDREFIQCDVDVVGIKNMSIEAELISLFLSAFQKLNIDVTIKYNNRKLLIGVLNELGIDKYVNEVITVIDKLEKLSNNELLEEFRKLNIDDNTIGSLLEILNLDFNSIKEKYLNTSNNTLQEGLQEIEELNKYIKKLNKDNNIIFTLSLARGQEYYTSTVFEVFTKDKIITSSIGGGGRYDKMITNFVDDGNEYPAIGISFGLNVIYEILKNRSNINSSLVDLYIIPLNTDVESLLLANNLRENGLNVDVEMKGRKLNKALDFANRQNIPYVIVLGENEITNNLIEIKDMVNSKSIQIKLDDINKILEIIKIK